MPSPAPSNSGPRDSTAQYIIRLTRPLRGWRIFQIRFRDCSMVRSIRIAVTIRISTPAPVRLVAWRENLLRYSRISAPADGTKYSKAHSWITMPRSFKAGIAAITANITVMIGTMANSVV